MNKLKHRLGSKSSIISAECMGVYHEVAVKIKSDSLPNDGTGFTVKNKYLVDLMGTDMDKGSVFGLEIVSIAGGPLSAKSAKTTTRLWR